jgi:hypothetical protein
MVKGVKFYIRYIFIEFVSNQYNQTKQNQTKQNNEYIRGRMDSRSSFLVPRTRQTFPPPLI